MVSKHINRVGRSGAGARDMDGPSSARLIVRL